MQCCDKAIQMNPNYSYTWYNKGLALHALGEYNEALECFEKTLQLNPNYALAWASKVAVLSQSGIYDEALECFDKALEIDPNHTLAQKDKTIVLNLLNKQSSGHVGNKEEKKEKIKLVQFPIIQ